MGPAGEVVEEGEALLNRGRWTYFAEAPAGEMVVGSSILAGGSDVRHRDAGFAGVAPAALTPTPLPGERGSTALAGGTDFGQGGPGWRWSCEAVRRRGTIGHWYSGAGGGFPVVPRRNPMESL
jgi:hypothetical protein